MKTRIALLLVIIIAIVVPGSGQEPYYFVMLTDTQLGLYASNNNSEQETANYEFAVATVNRLKPRFVIVLGDLVNKSGDEAQIREYKRISGKIDPSIPFYQVAGNHDVEPQPTPQTLAFYREKFGPDYYSFREGPLYGIVLDSSLMMDPKLVFEEYENQKAWLEKELKTAKESGASRIIVFQHHPYFMGKADEPDAAWTIPAEYRKPMLELLKRYGVQYVFAGHTHKNNAARDEALEVITIAPVGMPFDKDDSGITIGAVTGSGVEYRYYSFGRLPNKLTIQPAPVGFGR
jgi:serine/threonine-protein phosphatase CPPED1